MASTGFLFPRNEVELARFEKLYDDVEENLSGHQIDPEVILGRKPKTIIVPLKKTIDTEKDLAQFRMVARKGSNLPQHIQDKMKNNHQKRKENDTRSEEDRTE